MILYAQIQALISLFCFGSTFVVTKHVNKGDGFFFQWLMCFGIFMTALVNQVVSPDTQFDPWAMGGGIVWSFGNLFNIAVIDKIGMAVGMLIWSSSNSLTGWATGNFGLFGVPASPPRLVALNQAGVVINICATLLFLFIKPNVKDNNNQEQLSDQGDDESIESALINNEHQEKVNDDVEMDSHHEFNTQQKLSEHVGSQNEIVSIVGFNSLDKDRNDSQNNKYKQTISTSESINLQNQNQVLIQDTNKNIKLNSSYDSVSDFSESDPKKLSESRDRILGIIQALIVGCCFGSAFDTVNQIRANCNKFECFAHEQDYIFSHLTGIFLASTIQFLGQIAQKKHRIQVSRKLIIPGILSGLIRGIAIQSWFYANDILPISVSVPLVAAGPGVVSTLWGIFLFKEIKGIKNQTILGTATMMMFAGNACIGISK